MQSVPITTNIASSNPTQARCTWYNIMCDTVCKWLATYQWFSGVPSTNKTDCHDIPEILLKVALHIIILNLFNSDDMVWLYIDLTWQVLTINLYFTRKTMHSKTCLNRTPLELKNLFILDRCLVYTGSNYIDI